MHRLSRPVRVFGALAGLVLAMSVTPGAMAAALPSGSVVSPGAAGSTRSALLPGHATGSAVSVAGSASLPSSAQTTTQNVTLITGDQVSVTTTPGEPPAVQVTRGPGTPASVQFEIWMLGNQIYVVPTDATEYIGGALDISLFDVTALLAAGYGNSALPLNLGVTDSAAGAALPPGLSRAGPGRLRESRASARQFAAALASHWRRDRLASTPPSQRLFAGAGHLTLAGTASPPPNSAGVRFHTLTVRAFDRNGNLDTGDIAAVQNVDNGGLFDTAQQSFINGRLAYSVPPGDYSVAAWIFTPLADGGFTMTLAVAPEVRVQNDTTVILRASRGQLVSAHAPQPTQPEPLSASIVLQRDAVTGAGFATDLFLEPGLGSGGPEDVYVTPTTAVTTGTLDFFPYFRLADPTGGSKYIYDMEFPSSGRIPADLTYSPAASQFATVDTDYHSSVQGRTERESRAPALPGQDFSPVASSDVAAPLSRTEFVLPQPGMVFLQQLVQNLTPEQGQASDVWRSYQPQTTYHSAWTAQPTVPGLEQETAAAQICPFCRVGNDLFVQISPFTDASGHYSFTPVPGDTTSLQLFQDGALVGTSASGTAVFQLSSDPASYSLVMDASRTASWWPAPTHTHTQWTFSSQARPGDTLPPGWVCVDRSTTNCSFENVLFASYQTNAGIDDVVPAGTQATVSLNIHHQLGDDSGPPVSSVAVSVSFDDGATWTPVEVTQTGDGTYQVSYPQPSIDQTTGFASLHVVASDSAGDTIDQTITRAYPLSVTPPSAAVTSPPPSSPPPGTAPPAPMEHACAVPESLQFAQCMAIINTDLSGVSADGVPNGYGPADLQDAYKLPVSRGAGQTVGIVDAFDDPNAEADLATYRSQFGLPACTSENGCFRKVNQQGQAGPLPSPDPGWGAEISLDMDMVSAACPNCHILLVEANDASAENLGASVDTAVALGANVVSNSYGSDGEFADEQDLDQFYNHPGTAIVAAAGDYGYGNEGLNFGGPSYPAVSRFVTAVGGTTLTRDNSARGWTESAWADSTSGCSAYVSKPAWQKDHVCGMRTVADVAAVADPATGVAVYDTFGEIGWLVAGGTSAAAPIIASAYALAGDASRVHYGSAPYAHPGDLFDVTTGTNGTSSADCLGTYLCNAGPGYDGPTGLGTPDGVGAFSAPGGS